MAASIRDSLLGYLGVLDRRLVDTGKSTPLYLSGGAAVVLAYGSTERTKDVDAFVAERNEVLDQRPAWAAVAAAKRPWSPRGVPAPNRFRIRSPRLKPATWISIRFAML